MTLTDGVAQASALSVLVSSLDKKWEELRQEGHPARCHESTQNNNTDILLMLKSI